MKKINSKTLEKKDKKRKKKMQWESFFTQCKNFLNKKRESIFHREVEKTRKKFIEKKGKFSIYKKSSEILFLFTAFVYFVFLILFSSGIEIKIGDENMFEYTLSSLHIVFINSVLAVIYFSIFEYIPIKKIRFLGAIIFICIMSIITLFLLGLRTLIF